LLPERPNEGGLRGTACAKFLVLIVSLVGVEIELDRGPISYVTEDRIDAHQGGFLSNVCRRCLGRFRAAPSPPICLKIALLFLIHMGRDARDSTTNNSAVTVSSDAHMMKSDLQLGKNF
jgi:hypothetical protein